MNLPLSVLITSLPLTFSDSLREIVRLGFGHVDLVGRTDRSDDDRASVADSGLFVDCVALGRNLPAGCSLADTKVESRRRAVEYVQRQIADAAQFGARVAYLVPCESTASLTAFADACGVLAAYARGRMIQLCVEHFPGSALPTAAGTLDWLHASGLDGVKLVLDLGHCLISNENPTEVVVHAGDRLGYVQLDDNDGKNDVHWSLLTGVLTEATLKAFLSHLRQSGYDQAIALELNGTLPDASGNLARSKAIVERMREES